MACLPGPFVRTVVELHGPRGEEWLAALPRLLEECARRWSLTLGSPVDALSYNFVAAAVRADGSPAILKLGVPVRELLTEIEALRVYDGRGAARLLDADPDAGALLLERLTPGKELVSLSLADDALATSAAAEVMRRLRFPAPAEHSLPMVADWLQGFRRHRDRFGGGSGPIPQSMLERAEALSAELLASSGPAVLLHGDLHHANILSTSRDGWLAIDPKGLIGEAEYEIGALIRNPMPQVLHQPGLRDFLSRRLDRLARELDFDRERLLAWSYAQAVLSAVWSIEDFGCGGEEALAIAEHLR